MAEIDQTGDEVLDSLTGFEEAEIAEQFGYPVAYLTYSDELLLGRALVFITKRRAGLADIDARNAAMNMPLGNVRKYFAAESVEAGKGEQADEKPPSPSLTSVS